MHQKHGKASEKNNEEETIMNNEAAREYLEAIAEFISDNAPVKEHSIEEADEIMALNIALPSPLEEKSDIVYSIQMCSFDEDKILYRLIIFIEAEIPEEMFPQLHRVIGELNNLTIVGSFRLEEAISAVIYAQGIVQSMETNMNESAVNILRTLGIMENAMLNGSVLIRKLLSGEAGADEVIAEIRSIGGAL